MQETQTANSSTPAERSLAAPPVTSLTRSIDKPQLGRIFQQYQQHEHFSLAVVHTQLENDLELTTESMATGVNMNFILSGSILTKFSALPQAINLNQTRHNLLYINNTSGHHIFRKGQLFHNLHVSLSEEYFKELCPPTSIASERLHTHILKQQPVLASQHHGTITLQMQQAINNIFTCEFKGAMQKLYMESKVLELLALQLQQFELHQEKNLFAGHADKTLAHDLQQYLELNFLQAPSIKELAKVFGTNEFRLKKVFREHTGRGIFSYAQRLRMQYAHGLLQESSVSIAQVAEKVGYSHANHFSNAFKKQFGCSPSEIKYC